MNDFDKKVKEQAGSFGMEPREHVWPRIADELAGKKRRRFAIWIWLLVPVLLAGGVWIALPVRDGDTAPKSVTENHKKQEKATASTVEEMQDEMKVLPGETMPAAQNKNDKTQQQSTTTHIAQTHKLTQTLPGKATTPLTTHPGTGNYISTPHTHNPALPPSARQLSSHPGASDSIHPGHITPEVVLMPIVTQDIAATTALDTTAGKGNPNADRQPEISAHSTLAVVEIVDGIAITEIPVVRDSSLQSVPMNLNEINLVTAGTLPLIKKAAAQWRVMAGVGLHNHTGGGLSLNKSLADFNSALPQNAFPGSTIGALQPTEPGLGFMAGVERTRAIGNSKRWQWMAGMHYQYQSMRIKTGLRKDSTLQLENNFDNRSASTAYYFRPGSSVEQTGSQHRIHLVAGLHMMLGGKQQWVWHNAAYGGIVMTHNYLVPQSLSTGWIPSKNVTRLGYYGIETGIRFQKNPWGAGIYGQYNLQSSTKNVNLPPQYWRGLELRLQYQLPSSAKK